MYVDGPPLAPVIDSTIIARQAGATLFVVAWSATPRAVVERALKSLDRSAGRIAGIVVNNAKLDQLAGYDGYYGYYLHPVAGSRAQPGGRPP